MGAFPSMGARARNRSQSNRHISTLLQGGSAEEDYRFFRFIYPYSWWQVLVSKDSGRADLMVLTSSVGCFSALERSRLSSEAAVAGSTTALASRPPLLAS